MSKLFLDTVGKRIRILRQDLGLNQAELVHELEKRSIEVGRSYISELERTDKVPSGMRVSSAPPKTPIPPTNKKNNRSKTPSPANY